MGSVLWKIILFSSLTQFCNNFEKTCPGIKATAKDQLVILGAPLRRVVKRDFLFTKIKKTNKISNTVEYLDAHYGFYLLRNYFRMPKLKKTY